VRGPIERVVLTAHGQGATAAWGGRGLAFWARHFTPAAGWGPPQRLDRAGAAAGPGLALASTPDGRVVALFEGARMWWRRSEAAGAWTELRPVTQSPVGGGEPELRLAADGSGAAAWTRVADASHGRVFGSRILGGNVWTEARELYGSIERSVLTGVAMNGRGDGLAVWHQWRDEPNARVTVWASQIRTRAF
jgi:hypothetical protein